MDLVELGGRTTQATGLIAVGRDWDLPLPSLLLFPLADLEMRQRQNSEPAMTPQRVYALELTGASYASPQRPRIVLSRVRVFFGGKWSLSGVPFGGVPLVYLIALTGVRWWRKLQTRPLKEAPGLRLGSLVLRIDNEVFKSN